VKSQDIAITIVDDIPEPAFTLAAPETWDGRQTIKVTPQISNLAAMQAKNAAQLSIQWTIDDVAAITTTTPDQLVLNRSLGSGQLKITATVDNGGAPIQQAATITVQEPPTGQDPWITAPISEIEQPEDNQFISRQGNAAGEASVGTLRYAGKLTETADSMFLKVFADDQLFATETAKPGPELQYSLSVNLKPGLIKYRTEFGCKKNGVESVLHRAANIVCGDAFIIIGQSNAVATDFGKDNPLKANDWIRTFGSTAGDPNGSRLKLWAPAEARSPGGRSEIGYWGMELGRRICRERTHPCLHPQWRCRRYSY
jgi:hypothetical protein